MKRTLIVAVSICFPVSLLLGQSAVETVFGPQYDDFDVEFIADEPIERQEGDGNISSNLIAQPTQESTDQESSGEIEITTEIGTTTFTPRGNGDTKEEYESLSDVVSRINAQYDEQAESCETGSWLTRIWCNLTSWF